MRMTCPMMFLPYWNLSETPLVKVTILENQNIDPTKFGDQIEVETSQFETNQDQSDIEIENQS